MTWNYRIVKRKHKNGDVTYGVHDCYYKTKKSKLPHSCSKEPQAPVGETIKDLHDELDRFSKAMFDKILDYDTLKEVENSLGHKIKK